jgi:hypothetical protein
VGVVTLFRNWAFGFQAPHGETAMRRYKSVVAAFAALFVTLVFCVDSEACHRGRRCATCQIPCWVDCRHFPNHEKEFVCFCCTLNGWQPSCNGCSANNEAWVLAGQTPSGGCATQRGPCGCCSHCSPGTFCAMVCDETFHVLRFARPWEPHTEFYPLCKLGTCCPH